MVARIDFYLLVSLYYEVAGPEEELGDAVYVRISCMQQLGCAKEGNTRALESLKRFCERFVSGLLEHEKKKMYTIACPKNSAEKTIYGEITLES